MRDKTIRQKIKVKMQKAEINRASSKYCPSCIYLSLSVCFLIVSLIFPVTLHAAPKSDLQELRGRIDSLKKEIETAEETRNEASDGLKKSEQAISKMSRNLYELDQQQQSTKADLDKLGSQSQQTQGSIGLLQAQLGQLLYQQYLHGQQDPLVAMLNQQDANQISRQLHYYSYIARARSDTIQSLQKNLVQLQNITQRTQEKNTELARIKEEQANQKKQLLAEQETKKKVLANIAQKIAGHRKEISRLQQDEKRLTRLVEQLAKITAKLAKVPAQSKLSTQPKQVNNRVPDATLSNSAFQQLKGKMHLPITGELSNRFGTPREEGGSSWKGLFIRANSGQPVKAVASGRVVFADWLRGFGNLIIIDHDNNYMSLYGNNESIYKHVGDTVKAGDNIAAVGNSGGNPHAGLYFELRHQSKPFDPLTWTK